MTITRRRLNATAFASLLMPSIATHRARAQASPDAWPTRPVRIVVPFAAGGPTDVIARIVGERLAKNWGQQVVIENRPGGGTNIANEMVLRSEPDGHAVLMGGSSQATTRGLYHSLSYDPIGDFAPVALICSYSFFMFVPNSLPVKSVGEFIAHARANKGKLTLASPGTGSSPHLCGELFKHMAGIDMVHVPYRGAAPAMNDLIPGRVHLLFSGGATLDNARSGHVRVLGYTGAKRAAIAPEVPTIAERHSRIQCGVLVRLLCTGQDAKGNHHENQCRHHRRARRSERPRAIGAAGLRKQTRSARKGRGISQSGSRTVGSRHQGGRHRPAGLIAIPGAGVAPRDRSCAACFSSIRNVIGLRYFIISSGGIGPQRLAASGVFGQIFGRCGLSRCQGRGSK